LDRITIAYSHSTPKRLARLVALVPIKPKNPVWMRRHERCRREGDSFLFPNKTEFRTLPALPRVLSFLLTLMVSLLSGSLPAAGISATTYHYNPAGALTSWQFADGSAINHAWLTGGLLGTTSPSARAVSPEDNGRSCWTSDAKLKVKGS
jgi:hypothetical protein